MLAINNDLMKDTQEALSFLQQIPPFSEIEIERRKETVKFLRGLIEPWKKKLLLSQYTTTLSKIAEKIDKNRISSEQAWQLGYICLREAPGGAATVPGQWVLPNDLITIFNQISQLQEAKDKRQDVLKKRKTEAIEKLIRRYSDISTLNLEKLYSKLNESNSNVKDLFQDIENYVFEHLAQLFINDRKTIIFQAKTSTYQIAIESAKVFENSSGFLTFSISIPENIKSNILKKEFDLVNNWVEEQTQNWIKQTQNQLTNLQEEVLNLIKVLNLNQKLSQANNPKLENYLQGLLGELKHKWKSSVTKLLSQQGLTVDFSKHTLAIKAVKTSHKFTFAGRSLSLRLPLELPKQERIALPLYQENPQEYAEKVLSYVQNNCLASLSREITALNNLEIEEPSDELKPYFDQNSLINSLGKFFHKVTSSKKTVSVKKVLEQINEIKERAFQQARSILQAKEAERITRIGSYPEHFQLARSLSRRLTLYVGPTNSGKTYQALNILAQAKTGCYLAPLRLLALEGQEELLKRGCLTSFLTGEERDIRLQATHLAATIEMIDTNQIVEVAVIDEAQMLFDKDRGWAWTTAIFGVAAKHVVLTGAPSCIKMIEKIAEHLEEPLEIVYCERFTEMQVLSKPSKLNDIEPASALIAFSRRDVLGLKAQLESMGKNISVIYGNLSPEVRREEARRFRSGEADVVVATDAIGMGLNLPIKTLLFWTTEKWDGQEHRELHSEEIRQIAGRAGRYGMYEKAFIGAFNQWSLKLIAESLKLPINSQISHCQVMPGIALVEQIANVLETSTLAKILKFFRDKMLVKSPLLCSARMEAVISLAERTDSFSHMLLSDRLVFACAPVDIRDVEIIKYWQSWLNSYQRNQIAKLTNLPRKYTSINSVAQSHNELEEAERLTKILTTYAWLSYRFLSNFPDLEACDEQRVIVNQFIERSLRKKGLRRLCQQCGKALGPLYQYSTCETCYRSRYSYHSDDDDEDFW
ncbi:MAG: hypothetical protein HY819_13025 [Acidobacteria bacterium]|nr:hypothetical protein [Acidobacteriota bacterium]